MAMVCRRCNSKINEGEVAHVIAHRIVCDDCKEPHESGFRESPRPPAPLPVAVVVEPVPLEQEPEPIPHLTPRAVALLKMAARGDVTRQGRKVYAYDRETDETRDSKGIAGTLRNSGLAVWRQVTVRVKGEPSVRSVLELTELGMEALKQAKSNGEHVG